MAPKKSARGGAKPAAQTPAGTPPKGGATAKGDAKAKSARSPALDKREEPFAPATILLLGGYGAVGSAIARTLLDQSTTARVIIAGRTAEKARVACGHLNAEFAGNGERATPLTADASDSSSLSSCPKFDVLVNATTMRAVEGVITLMRFSASKRSHYFDLRGVVGLETAIAKAVGDVQPVVLMGGGFCPGAIAPLLKYSASKLAGLGGSCSQAHMYIAATALPSQAEEAIEAMMSGVRLEDYHHGKWQPATPSQSTFVRKMDFGDGKVRTTTPVGMAEVTELPTELSLDHCSVRFASSQDGGLMCAAIAVLCCAPCVGLQEGVAKHLRAAMQRQQAKEPYLCTCVCEATGVDREGKPRRVVLSMSHPAGPAAMAAHCAVAQLTQILDLSITGGVPPRLCGVATDGDKLLTALIRQGVEASIKTIDASDPNYDA
jgi:hypothetical protein